MKLSVIIPVYQVESTLRRCVGSVVGQHVDDSEVILVDDGSTDSSPAICDELAKQCSNVRAIHKANGGLSDARNTGLDAATGDYVTFVDSDDYLAPGTYKALMAVLGSHPDADLLEYPVLIDYGSKRQRKLDLPDRAYSSAADYWLQGRAYAHSYACNKIFRRGLFSGVRFPKGRVFEDVHTLPLLLAHCRLVMTTRQGLYYYCFNASGITHSATGKELLDLLDGHMKYIDSGAPVDARYYAHVLNIQMDVYEQADADPVLPVMPFWSTCKLTLLHIIGLKNLCKLNKFIHRLTGRYR